MSRKDDLINSYGGVNGILSQTPDVKARIRNELLEASRQDAIEANQQADKAAQGSLTNDLAGVGGQVAGVVGGSYLGGQIFGGGSAAASGAGAGAGGAVGGAAGTGATAGGAITPIATGGTAAGVTSTGAAAPAAALGESGLGASLLPGAGIAAGAYTGYQQIKGAQNAFNGKPMDWQQKAALALPTFGLSLLPFGHSKRYYEGEDRKKLANSINEKYGADTLNAEQFDNDPTSWSYDLKSPGVNKELGGAQALTALLTGEKSGSKMWGDLSSRFANDIKSGTPVKDLYAKYGLDYNKAMEGIGASSYDTKLKAELQNGLNDAFGQQPRQQSSQGSPGRRPQQQSNSNSSVKKKAKDSSNALSKLWK